MLTEPTIGELFAGYGGLGMGVQAALGGRLAWVSDIDAPAAILAHRFPDVPNLGDITAVDWATVPRVNILTGGSPCQDISNAGAMAGMVDGTRSNLWVAMRTAIEQLSPDLVVWENVGGALNAGAASDVEPCPGCMGGPAGVHMRALGRVLGDLASLGFDAEWVCVRATDAGAPHKRFRVFVVAWPTAHSGGLRWLSWRGHGAIPTHRGWTSPDLARRPCVPLELLPTHTIADLLPTPAVNDMGDNKTAKRLHRDPDQPTPWGVYEPAVQRWADLTRPAPTPVELGRKGNLRLAAAFPEWMMGLPEGWVTDVPGLTRTDMLKACGNGVVPQQAHLAIETLRRRILA